MTTAWKPISEYPCIVGPHNHGPIVLVRKRDENGIVVEGPCCAAVIHGHFYTVPGVPMYYGKRKCGWMTCDHMTEFTDIPE